VQQHRVGKTHTGKMGGPNSFPLGFKTHITPSKEALHRHLEAIGRVIKSRQTQNQKSVIGPLNLIIRGWANYYSRCMASEIFSKADHLTWIKLMSWAKRRHNNKSVDWITNKYWHTHERIGKKQVKWDFATHDGARLLKHQQFHIVRHIKIREDKNPFDGDWVYWATRMGRHPDLNDREAQLLKRQQGKCPWCELYFKDGDVLELDHIIPRSLGGKDGYINWQVLHRHCHDRKTAGDGSLTTRGIHNTG
jgi:RNA-directed DNA polymerase